MSNLRRNLHVIILSISHTHKLMNVVQESVGDVQGLHSKLERKSHVEDTNMTAASAFQSHLSSDLDALHSTMVEHSQSVQQKSKHLADKIGEFCVALK